MAKKALVVSRNVLFEEGYFQGFIDTSQRNFVPIILQNSSYMEREDKLEQDESVQQIIPYVWIVNPVTKKVFIYKRTTTKDYKEERLKGKLSGGIGGHIDETDSGHPIIDAMMRELREEVSMDVYPTPRVVGYINDDTDSVGRVHFGVVAIAETTREVKKGDDEMSEGRFYSIGELEELFQNPQGFIVENWTKFSWPFVKQYLTGN